MAKRTVLVENIPSNREITAQARRYLKGKYGGGALLVLILAAFSMVTTILNVILKAMMKRELSGANIAVLSILVLIQVAFGWYKGAFTNIFHVSALNLLDGGRFQPVKTLRFVWENLIRATFASALAGLITILKYLLLIVPGIMATYDYSMTWFCLADDPELNARSALKRSRAIMYGHRWQLFCLFFRMLGWLLLCAVTLGIACFWVTPYLCTVYAVFYRSIVPVREDGSRNDEALPVPQGKNFSRQTSMMIFILLVVVCTAISVLANVCRMQ